MKVLIVQLLKKCTELFAKMFAIQWACVLLVCVSLTACGGSEPSAPPPQPAPLEPQTAVVETVAGPPSLPQPPPAEAPVNAVLPAAPSPSPAIRLSRLGTQASLSAAPTKPSPTVRWRVVARSLAEPTDLAFAPGGAMFYTERERGLWVVRADQAAVNVLPHQAPGADARSALLSVAVDPDFARTRTVYVFVAEAGGQGWRGRVIRLRLDTSLAKVTDRQDIATDIDWGASATAPRSVDDLQLGGRLRFGPGGHLYLGLGDGRSPTAPQSATALGGKVLRIARDGTAAAGNPVLPGFDPRVFAYGFRQPMGLSFHPNTEDLVLAERGGEHPDEITIVKPGANGGWDPRCPGQASDAYCGHVVSAGVAGTMTDIGRHPNATMPTWRGLSGGEGLSSSVVLRDPAWKDWTNALVVAFSHAKRIDLIKMDHLGQVAQQGTLLNHSLFGFQAVAQGPNGLYAVTSGKAGGEEIWQLLLR